MPFTTVDLLRCSLPILTKGFQKLSPQPKQPEMIALISRSSHCARRLVFSALPFSRPPMARARLCGLAPMLPRLIRGDAPSSCNLGRLAGVSTNDHIEKPASKLLKGPTQFGYL